MESIFEDDSIEEPIRVGNFETIKTSMKASKRRKKGRKIEIAPNTNQKLEK